MKKTNLLFSFLCCITLISCNNKVDSNTYTITDLRNRQVEVPYEVNKVVCIGASALRLYSYVGDLDKLVGVEEFEKGNKMPVRPYSYAYKELFANLPSIGVGGPNSTYDAEAILSVKPDVIFSLYDNVESMNTLEKTINIPVVCLSYGGSDPFSDQVYTSLSLIGQITNNKTRSDYVINYIKEIKNDLNQRTKDIKDEDKPKVYLGCNTYNGGKGTFNDSLINYACFREINAKNIFSNENYNTNNVIVDLETIVSLNPDMIFVDVANISNLKNEYNEKKAIFDTITAFKNNDIYVQMPFNQYYTNLEIAIADSYYLGSVIYPNSFKDINPINKFDEICENMLNKKENYYQLVSSFYNQGFGKLSLE